MRRLVLCLFLFTVGALEGSLLAQTGTYFNPRDDQFKLLGLKRGLDAYNIARADYERQKELFEKGLSSRADLERAERTYRDAEVNYQQSFLAVIYERRYIAIEQAVKSQRADGTRRVKLTLANMTSGTSDIKRLLNIEEGLYALVQPDVINDIYVSLMNDQGAIISQPY